MKCVKLMIGLAILASFLSTTISFGQNWLSPAPNTVIDGNRDGWYFKNTETKPLWVDYLYVGGGDGLNGAITLNEDTIYNFTDIFNPLYYVKRTNGVAQSLQIGESPYFRLTDLGIAYGSYASDTNQLMFDLDRGDFSDEDGDSVLAFMFGDRILVSKGGWNSFEFKLQIPTLLQGVFIGGTNKAIFFSGDGSIAVTGTLAGTHDTLKFNGESLLNKLSDAPIDGGEYARKDGAWVDTRGSFITLMQGRGEEYLTIDTGIDTDYIKLFSSGIGYGAWAGDTNQLFVSLEEAVMYDKNGNQIFDFSQTIPKMTQGLRFGSTGVLNGTDSQITYNSLKLITEAPSDGSEYARKDGSWAVVSGGGGGGGGGDGGGGDIYSVSNNTFVATNSFKRDTFFGGATTVTNNEGYAGIVLGGVPDAEDILNIDPIFAGYTSNGFPAIAISTWENTTDGDNGFVLSAGAVANHASNQAFYRSKLARGAKTGLNRGKITLGAGVSAVSKPQIALSVTDKDTTEATQQNDLRLFESYMITADTVWQNYWNISQLSGFMQFRGASKTNLLQLDFTTDTVNMDASAVNIGSYNPSHGAGQTNNVAIASVNPNFSGGSGSSLSAVIATLNSTMSGVGGPTIRAISMANDSAQVLNSRDSIIGATLNSKLLAGTVRSVNLANYDSDMSGVQSATIATEYSDNSGYNSAIIGGSDADNTGDYSFMSGYEINNDHHGNFMWRGYDGNSTEISSTKSNTVMFFTQGFGINTNNPQVPLHVNGDVRFDGSILNGTNVLDLVTGTYNANAIVGVGGGGSGITNPIGENIDFNGFNITNLTRITGEHDTGGLTVSAGDDGVGISSGNLILKTEDAPFAGTVGDITILAGGSGASGGDITLTSRIGHITFQALNGNVRVINNATSGTDVVNYRTMTNAIAGGGGGGSTSVYTRTAYESIFPDFAGNGYNNAITTNNVISGGINNQIGSSSSTYVNRNQFIGGGSANSITSILSDTSGNVIVGGGGNINKSQYNSSIVGGQANQITTGSRHFLGGGYGNTISASESATIGGGWANSLSAPYTFLGGGYGNYITLGTYGTIGGGWGNYINGTAAGYCFIGGGQANFIRNSALSHNTIGGGSGNQIQYGTMNTIVGGNGNYLGSRANNNVLGGYGNYSDASHSMVFSYISSVSDVNGWAGIIGGRNITIDEGGSYAGTVGGVRNYTSGRNSFVAGSYNSTNTGDYAFMLVNFASINNANHAGVIGGVYTHNTSTATNAFIIGGNGYTNSEPNQVVIPDNLLVVGNLKVSGALPNQLSFVYTQTNTTQILTISFTNGSPQRIYQTTAITNLLFTGMSSNLVDTLDLTLITDSNSVNWLTAVNVIWAAGVTPTHDTNDVETFMFRCGMNTNKLSGAYIQDD